MDLSLEDAERFSRREDAERFSRREDAERSRRPCASRGVPVVYEGSKIGMNTLDYWSI